MRTRAAPILALVLWVSRLVSSRLVQGSDRLVQVVGLEVGVAFGDADGFVACQDLDRA